MPPDQDTRAPRPAILLVLALALVASAHLPSLGGGFVWDDHPLIEHEPSIQTLAPVGTYFRRMFWNASDEASGSFYRPLTTLSFALDYARGAGAAFPFHVTNLLAHLACCALLFALARRSGAGPVGAAVAAALWGTLPRLTESVAWISGRTDVLASLGALAALLAYGVERERAAGVSWPRSLGAAAALLFGLFCKEVAAAALVAVLALELARWRHGQTRAGAALARLAPLGAATALYPAFRLAAAAGAPHAQAAEFTLGQRLGIAVQALGTFATMLLTPLWPALQIGRLGLADPAMIAVGLATLALVAVAAWRLSRRPEAVPTVPAVALGVAAIAPVLHLIPLPVYVVAADRYLYLPAAGLAVALAAVAPRLTPKAARLSLVTAGALLVAFTASSWARAGEWSDDLTLFSSELRRGGERTALAHAALGEALLDRERPEEALRHLDEAIAAETELSNLRGWKFAVNFGRLLNNRAVALQRLGRDGEAIAALEDLLKRYPDRRVLYVRLAYAYARTGDFARARDVLARSPAPQAELGPVAARLAQLERARSSSDLVARARALAELRDVRGACAAWSAVLSAPSSAQADVEAGARFALTACPADVAKAALERWKAVGAPPAEIEAAEQALADRFRPAP